MTPLALPRSLDIAAVAAVAADLRRALAAGDLIIDARAVAKVDAAGLQLLCAAAIDARARGVALTWRDVPPVLVDGARILALADTLGWAHTSEVR